MGISRHRMAFHYYKVLAMVDAGLSFLDHIIGLLKWVAGGVIGLIGYKLKKTDEELGDLKKTTVNKDQFDKDIDHLSESIERLSDKMDDDRAMQRREMREDLKIFAQGRKNE